jgi:hypothetical protein
MTQPGYQQGAERAWWWKVAQHLDATVLAATNAMAHNVDDPTLVVAFQETVRQAQAILFEIFRAKGLLPAAPNGAGPSNGGPPRFQNGSPPPGFPNGMQMPPMGPPPGVPMGPPPGMPMTAPPMTGPAVPEEAMAAGGIPFSMGSAFAPPPAPPGWPDMSAPPPAPPGWPDMSEPEPAAAAAAPEVVESIAAPPEAEGLDYGDDAGKGFENQEAQAPAATPEAEA